MRRATCFGLASALLLLGIEGTAAERARRDGPGAKTVRTRAQKKQTKPRPKHASPPSVPLDAAVVNDAALATPIGRGSKGGAVLRAQVLLARAHFSVGEIDAVYGENMRKAVSEFQKARALSDTGVVDAATWQALDVDGAPVIGPEAIGPDDVAGPFTAIPEDMMEKAKLPAMGFASPIEALAEKHHASPALLKALNPGASFDQAGTAIQVPLVASAPPGKAARIVVSKSERSVEALAADGRVLAWYPATIGSDHDPLPVGPWKVLGVQRNPEFHYNPELFWDAKTDDKKTTIAPGPNNPVGVAWIDLSKPHYGIHGTPEPATIGKTQSHGCIRLTNWDVWELQQMVSPGTPAMLED
jgi:lipoprotein-anchoring transpeptidase ErfK/SrfK